MTGDLGHRLRTGSTSGECSEWRKVAATDFILRRGQEQAKDKGNIGRRLGYGGVGWGGVEWGDLCLVGRVLFNRGICSHVEEAQEKGLG
jgi:hypothetical protein